MSGVALPIAWMTKNSNGYDEAMPVKIKATAVHRDTVPRQC
jgi:hypothetical protein